MTYSEWLFTSKSEVFGFFAGWAMPTGVGLIAVMTVIGVGAIPWIREVDSNAPKLIAAYRLRDPSGIRLGVNTTED